MPLTKIQKQVPQIIAANRSPDSYVAGATVLHAEEDSGRKSDDLDLFSDYENAKAAEASALADERALREAGFSVVWEIQVPRFFRAVVSRDDLSLKLEWVGDSAFRFFPLERDPWPSIDAKKEWPSSERGSP